MCGCFKASLAAEGWVKEDETKERESVAEVQERDAEDQD